MGVISIPARSLKCNVSRTTRSAPVIQMVKQPL
jgi:hypothetical protein